MTNTLTIEMFLGLMLAFYFLITIFFTVFFTTKEIYASKELKKFIDKYKFADFFGIIWERYINTTIMMIAIIVVLWIAAVVIMGICLLVVETYNTFLT